MRRGNFPRSMLLLSSTGLGSTRCQYNVKTKCDGRPRVACVTVTAGVGYRTAYRRRHGRRSGEVGKRGAGRGAGRRRRAVARAAAWPPPSEDRYGGGYICTGYVVTKSIPYMHSGIAHMHNHTSNSHSSNNSSSTRRRVYPHFRSMGTLLHTLASGHLTQ